MTEANSSDPNPEEVPPSPIGGVSRRTVIIGTICILFFCLLCGILGYPRWRDYRTAQFLNGCKKAVAEKNWDVLEIAADGWLAWDPQSNDALLHAAEAARQLGNAREAADLLGKVSDSYHGALQALAFQGELLFGDLNLPYEAETTWKRMLAINSMATLPRQRLIYFYTMTLQRQKMVELVRESISIGCEPPEAYAYLLLSNNLNFTDGVVVTTNWRNNHPDDECLEVAQAIYTGRNKYDGDEAVFEKSDVAPGDQKMAEACLKKYPSNMEIISYFAEKRIYEGSAVEMITLLKNAPPEAAKDSRFWRFRGWLLNSQGRLPDAVEALRKSLELSPTNWSARYELSNILRAQGETEESATQSSIAIKGKSIEKQLFESPDARAISRELVQDMITYMEMTGEDSVALAFRKRTGLDKGWSDDW